MFCLFIIILKRMKITSNKQHELIPIIVNDFNLITHPFEPQVYRNYSFLVKKESYHKPRSEAARQNSLQRKKKYFLKRCIKTICDRYFINYFQQDLERMVEKTKQINKIESACKGLLETTAAVVFGEYWDHIRTKTTKQFCRINGLSVSAFNQKYKAYQRLYGQDSKKEKPEKQTQQHSDELDSQKQTNFPQIKEDDQLSSINSPLMAISLIYDILFKTDYFLFNRRSVIEKFNSIFEEFDPRIFKEIDWLKLHLQKIYHVFCAILRYAKSYLKFKDVRNAVQKKFGLIIYKNDCDKVWLIFKRYKNIEENSKENSNSQIKKDEISPISPLKIQE